MSHASHSSHRRKLTGRRLGQLALLVTCGLTGLPGCGGSAFTLGDHRISVDAGQISIDGVRLEHERWAEVALDTAGIEQLECGTISGPIELQGGESGTARLQVHVHSEVEGDGEVDFEGGKLAVRSAQGRLVYINGVRGTVPPELSLLLSTTSGDVSVERVARSRKLGVDTTSGDISAKGCESASVVIDTTSGDSRLEGCSAAALDVDSTSGDVTVVGGTWGTITVDGTSSDVLLQGCTVELAQLDATSGDLKFSGGHCQRAEIDTVSGDFELSDGAVVDEQRKR